MPLTYPNDATFNVNNFSVIASTQYDNTGTNTEFVLPLSVSSLGQILPYADGILQDFVSYDLDAFNGLNYSNVVFNNPLFASNLTIKVITVPDSFFTNITVPITAVLDYSNTVPVTVRSNTYIVDGIRTTFALPVVSNGNSKDNIIVTRNGVNQDQTTFTFPSASLNIYGIDMLSPPLIDEILELRIFDGGSNKYTRKTSIADRKADKGYSYTSEPQVKTTSFIAGYEKRRLITRRLKRKWTFGYTNITGIEKEAIEYFYRAVNGTFQSFSFDLSHLNYSGLATVVFDSSPQFTSVLSASATDLSQNFYTVGMVFREVDD
jgi:hypothetical protein